MPPTPFPAGKTVRELNIDLKKKFIVVKPDGESRYHGVKEGDIAVATKHWQTDSDCITCKIERPGGQMICTFQLIELAYYEPTEQEVWEPKEKDLVNLKGAVVQVKPNGSLTVSVGGYNLAFLPKDVEFFSRPAPRKVTMAEVCERFGETVIIEG